MEKIIWEERFNTQVAVIDAQHQQIVELINRLLDAQDQSTSDDEMADILGAMTNYFGYHFDTEEQMMIDYNYPEIESHREAHQTFVTWTAYFIATYREGGGALKKDILLFLKDWLVDHIIGSDGAFGRYIRATRTA